jgi:hypothetical protein
MTCRQANNGLVKEANARFALQSGPELRGFNAELVAEPIFPVYKSYDSRPYFYLVFIIDQQNITPQTFSLLFLYNGSPRKHQAIAALSLCQTYRN